jgi:hypothetical protein
MDNLPGKLLMVYVPATLLAAGAGAGLVHRYRAALPRLMRAWLDDSAPAAAVPASPPQARPPPPLPTAMQWRRAERRLVGGPLGLSAPIALTHGAITQWLYVDGPWRWPRFLLFSALLACYAAAWARPPGRRTPRSAKHGGCPMTTSAA